MGGISGEARLYVPEEGFDASEEADARALAELNDEIAFRTSIAGLEARGIDPNSEAGLTILEFADPEPGLIESEEGYFDEIERSR